MTGSRFLNSKAKILTIGLILFCAYSVIVIKICGGTLKSYVLQLVPIAIALTSIFIIRRDTQKELTTLKDDYLFLASFTAAALFSVINLISAGFPKYSDYMMCVIVLGSAEIDFFRDRNISFLQSLNSALIGFVFISLYPLSDRYMILFVFSLLMAWKFINLFYFKTFNRDHQEDLKTETYKSTIATINHELNNTSMIILGFTKRLKKRENSKELARIEESINKMADQIEKLQKVEKVEFEDYLPGSYTIKIEDKK